MSNIKDLIDRIDSYLQEQREIYGDFSVPDAYSNQPIEKRGQTESSPKKEPVKKAENSQQEKAGMAEKDISEKQQSSGNSLFSPEDTGNIYDRLNACQTMDELKDLCAEAEELKTDLENTNLVFGVGNPQADLLLIGEAPGQREDELGEPFVGRAGKLLDKILDAIDFDRKVVYIANILKHRPPKNRNPLPEERKRSLPFLMKQIELIDPKLILCLGKVSANTLLDNNSSMKSMRGDFHPFKNGIELMVTYHPAALLRNPNWKRPAWEDVQKLRDRYKELGCTP